MQGKLYAQLIMLLIMLTAWSAASAGSAMETDYVWVNRFQTTLNKAYEGRLDAQYELARMFEQGKGTQRDLGQALVWYRKSAKLGHDKSQARLGYMYLYGEGVDKNPGEGIKLLTAASEANNVRAQYHLAGAYEQGAGVGKDIDQARSWYQRSARGGYRPAKEALEKMEKQLAAAEARRQRAAAARKRAAEKKAAEKARKEALAQAARKRANSRSRDLTRLLFESTWTTDDTEALVLPSGVNECNQVDKNSFECLSSEMQRDIGHSTVIYVTRALIHDIDKDGRFSITYQNNVLHVKRHKSNNVLFGDDNDGDVRKGWQAKYQMDCQLGNEQHEVSCSQDNAPNSVFQRRAEPGPG